MSFTDEQSSGAEDYRNARALELAKAHHAAMGPAMRATMPGHANAIVGEWIAMPEDRRTMLVAVMRDLLDKGVIA